eukprot:TRINITY_DN4572_c0_g2_i3.p2 TRINITY_DN4572_c0_g2~~TRINITY_DN4572_c0_g2_i3.p2  ORF type:complete len:201 (-),score=-16.32 TRINITY_DN4572_c0_g2_i3:112-675(-)
MPLYSNIHAFAFNLIKFLLSPQYNHITTKHRQPTYQLAQHIKTNLQTNMHLTSKQQSIYFNACFVLSYQIIFMQKSQQTKYCTSQYIIGNILTYIALPLHLTVNNINTDRYDKHTKNTAACTYKQQVCNYYEQIQNQQKITKFTKNYMRYISFAVYAVYWSGQGQNISKIQSTLVGYSQCKMYANNY